MEVHRLILGCLQTNCYFICNNGEAIVIDPALNYKKILKKAEEYNVKIKAILLTHGHFDHVGAVKDLQKLGIRVYLSREDGKIMQENSTNFFVQTHKNFIPDVLLEDDDIINLIGLEIKVILTPGHTKGSCCFLCGDYLFSGDTLLKWSYGRVDLYSGNMEDMKNSLKKLFGLNKNYIVLPGHGQDTLLLEEKINLNY